MLSTLHIINLAIVSELLLECPAKMSAFTGETGAGKSIMIDAINLLFGEKADSSLIRPGADKCEISAQFFYAPDSPIAEFLQQHELDNDFAEIMIKRVIHRAGKTKFFVNGHICSVQQIKNLKQLLVHVHGQHEQHHLLSPQTHREHLDKFAQLNEYKLKLKNTYLDYLDLLKQVEYLKNNKCAPEQLQLWEYQAAEILALDPKPDELHDLYQQHHQLHHAQQYLQQTTAILNLLHTAEQSNIQDQLYASLQLLKHLPPADTHIHNTQQLLDSACIQIAEAATEIKQFANQVQLDPQRLHEIETRMSTWHQLARKLQIDAQELPQYANVLNAKISQYKNSEHDQLELEQQCQMLYQNYIAQAQQLTQLRKQYAPKLAAAIEHIIQELGMPHAKFEIDIQPLDDLHVHGMDKVEYLITTNPGSERGPLAKIVSGGELSRISLSIHLITAQQGLTPTLLFDEVDVGIGGATAMRVGQRLRELGERLQIFCVTHQPQVASCAHQHFLVQKHSQQQQTFSSIHELDQQGRIEEIARMLGGLTITTQNKTNAQELISMAQT